jgi:hypothetical protein
MPDSRPADYYLGCLDDSVFIDFNNYNSEQVFLKRISFDGYGCCKLNDQVIPMSKDDSIALKKMMDTQSIDQEILTIIIKKTIKDNKKLIWEDALAEYGFI